MKVNEECKVLCVAKLSQSQANLFAERIREEYRVHMIVDNLPGAQVSIVTMDDAAGTEREIYEDGFPVGRIGDDENQPAEPFLYNHVSFKLLYHHDDTFDGDRIVGFEVQPFSVKHEFSEMEDQAPTTCASLTDHGPQSVGQAGTVVFTYSVTWVESDIKWASRWDVYLKMDGDRQIHWFSILNSLIIVLFLSGMLAMIMLRTLHRDFSMYNADRTQEEIQEESGWKLVHADVFRPPNRPLMLSVLIGSGAQVFVMAVVTLVFALLGFLSPANRGGIITAMVVLFVLSAVFAGYTGARMYKMWGGHSPKYQTLATGLTLPGIMFGTFLVLNFMLMGEHSSGAVPFGTLFGLIAMWLCISLPLVFLGAYFGYKKAAITPPNNMRVNQIPRQIPLQLWYMGLVPSVLMAGILPFGAIFIELFFLLSSIWLNTFYYLFGFLFLVFVILGVTCAEISIVLVYFSLCSENWEWCWRAFLSSGAAAFYMALYSVFYFFTKMHVHYFVSSLLFFGYTFILVFALFVLTGSIGFVASMAFVHKIYSSIKID